MPANHIIGLDLGQVRDYTALVVLERQPAAWAVRHLQRFALGTRYPIVVGQVLELRHRLDCTLVADQTGVGRAVIDMFNERLRGEAEGVFRPVTITAGRRVQLDERGDLRVPKRELVRAVQGVLGRNQLRIARGLPEATALARELSNFRVRVTAKGRETYAAWRERDHDDLVLALALAVWWGEKTQTSEG
jgi:hypothetical protein